MDVDFLESNDRYKTLVESISDYAIFLLDLNGVIRSWNLGARLIKGYQAEEIIGQHFSVFYSPEDQARSYPQHELEVAKSVGRYEDEGWRIRKDGTKFWVNVVLTCLRDADGHPVGFAKVTRDLTIRRQQEEKLRVSEERYRELVSSVKDYAIFLLDRNGIVTTWNTGAENLKQYKPSEIIGQHFSKFYSQEDLAAAKPARELEVATATGRYEEEGWRLRKDGSRFWANVVLTAIKDKAGAVTGFSKVTRDMTLRKNLEDKLLRANEDLDRKVVERTFQLENALSSRDRSMSILSHELRTPLTSLRIDSQLAKRALAQGQSEALFEKTKDFITNAENQILRITKLVDDMLDVSKVSMDRLSMDVTQFNLSDVVQETVARQQQIATAMGVNFTCNVDPQVIVLADQFRIEQVVNNLLSNAIKYGGGKSVGVKCTRNGSQASIAVIDFGSGISSDDTKRIFQPFERVGDTNRASGMGLGLYICKKIMELHAGTIDVASQPGKGSVFTVRLPASI